MTEIDFVEETEEAKAWLRETVAKERDWINFEITNVNGVNYIKKTATIRFGFQCRYKWQLNASLKNVDREIHVVYDWGIGKFSSVL